VPTYTFLLYGNQDWYDAPEEVQAASFAAHGAFSQAVEAAGAKILGGEALAATREATTVHRRPEGAVVRDGAFIESKEALGGFYVVECADLDAAIALAKICPEDNVEIRPVPAM
jgi:hypothetical protein